MKSCDVAVIGGGLLGCFAARGLMRYKLSALLIEQEEDLCRGISRANAAVIYTGYDNKPGSVKARMTVEANAGFEKLCRELDVEFIRRGSLLLSYDEACDRVLEKKLRHGLESGVEALRLVSGEEAMALEPGLKRKPRMALHAPGTGTVNPWLLGIAAYENAVANGCEAMLGTKVLGMEKAGEGYIIKTDREDILCRAVINCAGLCAHKVREMLFAPEYELVYDASDFLVMDRHAPTPGMILMEERPQGKGISLVPTVEGNLLIESEARALDSAPFAFRREARSELCARAAEIINGVDEENIIRSFAAVRPNPRYLGAEGTDISSFVIDRAEPGFISLIGIKSPGLSCAEVLGRHVAEAAAEHLCAEKNESFDPNRRGIKRLRGLDMDARRALIEENRDYGDIVCLCEDISRAEIKEAIARGANSVEGVKRRLGSGMGACQGSRCSYHISRMLEVEK